ncbi:hypothetical protein KW783_02900 [Candidatus Parcubacteria bacterium]|nr:hypothetical protein [Candidatus Parcubacteria bacterium]
MLWIGILIGIVVGTVFTFTLRRANLFPDTGHRVYGMKDVFALALLLEALKEVTGLRKKMDIDSGPTHQRLLSDGHSVLAYFDDAIGELPRNAMSIVVKNPEVAAFRVYQILNDNDFKAEMHKPLPGLEKEFVMVTSVAFSGWGLAFRRAWPVMAWREHQVGKRKRAEVERLARL